MKEEFLHHAWKYRLFDEQALTTSDGAPLEVLFPGHHNADAGPDFFDARIKIGGQLWAGNVELHVYASDWQKHGHQTDAAYDSVILHVVYKEDVKLEMNRGGLMPTLELKERLNRSAFTRYLELESSLERVPCGGHVRDVPAPVLQAWLDRLLVERLEKRSRFILRILDNNKGDWEETFYQCLARSFGFGINADPFEMLARSLPLKIAAKNRDSLFRLEALFFGQAGLLAGSIREQYPRQLQKEYRFLKQKFSLKPMEGHTWKFSRMRPSNFPSLRIAQFSALVHDRTHLFSTMLELEHAVEWKQFFAAGLSAYWDDHYVFGKRSVKKEKRIGAAALELMIINTIAPLLFVYGRARGEEHYAERAMRLFESMTGETNMVTVMWKELGLEASSAGQTQALLELKKEYCDRKRCLQCAIGTALLKNTATAFT